MMIYLPVKAQMKIMNTRPMLYIASAPHGLANMSATIDADVDATIGVKIL